MGQIVFNFHDLILIMTALQCCFFSLFLVLTNSKKAQSDYFLAAFLVVLAFIPIHELIMWGAVFKLKVRDAYPGAYFILGFAYYIDTVLLMFYIKSLAFKDFQLSVRHLVHAIPLLIFLLYLIVFFYSRSNSERLAMIQDESFAYSAPYIGLDLFCRTMRVVNCIISFLVIRQYKHILQSTRSRMEGVHIAWLELLVIGFLIVTVIELTLTVAKTVGIFASVNIKLFEFLGLAGYYALFAVVNLLVFSSIRFFSGFEQVKHASSDNPSEDDINIANEYADKIAFFMGKEKPYLVPDITLSKLARLMNIPSRHLSITINRHFRKNFYEFINGYRVEEAKKLLASKQDKNITDIYLSVGFNSKSVFYTFFKKIVGQTPTQYRDRFDNGQ